MKRLLAVLLMVAASYIPLLAHDWSAVYEKARLSTVSLFHTNGTCTAFSINKAERYYLTAAHCLGEEMQMWKETTPGIGMQHVFNVTKTVKVSEGLDLALLQAEEGFAAILPGDNPRIGSEVAFIGYPFSEPELWLIARNVSGIKQTRAHGSLRQTIFYNGFLLPGMSGGPVLDVKGKLVGMLQANMVNQRHHSSVANGVSISEIGKFAKGFWEK